MNNLTKFQKKFILIAINLSFAVLTFDIMDAHFKKDYGITKKQAEKQLEDLKQKLL